MKHIHILGICGTFMGGLAQLAKTQGFRVTGCDANIYPPMSTQLERAGIDLVEGYDPGQFDPAPDLVVVGNALSRGNPAVEYLLDAGLPYISGPQWLGDYLLRDRDQPKWVLAVAGTHGKTTTAGMLAWILEYADVSPGFLIGGVPENFGVSARLGDTPFFVVEADEYDSAFFDKRSKFVHYHPRTAILNNLEYDHADIFADLNAIQTQFHHFVRTIPGNGLIIAPVGNANIDEVLNRGCWTPVATLGDEGDWAGRAISGDCSHFEVLHRKRASGEVRWNQTGRHNLNNGLAAIAAAHHVGVAPQIACAALSAFRGVKRRMEKLVEIDGVTVYDDFAHHPTAIASTLEGLRRRVGSEKIIAVIEPRSNTMRMGVHRETLRAATGCADQVFWYQPPELDWKLQDLIDGSPVPARVALSLDELQRHCLLASADGGHIVIMSNGGFGGFHRQLVAALQRRHSAREGKK